MKEKLSKPSQTIRSASSRLPKAVRWIALVVIVLALGGGGYAYYRYRQAQASAAQQPTLQTATARQGNLVIRASGTGTLVAAAQVNLGFGTNGQIAKINVSVGDQVKAGQLLAQLNDTTQQIALAQAKQNLLELTSPSAIATTQQAVAQDQQNLYNAQGSLNNLQYMHTNQELIQNALASLTLAQNQLSHAQAAYNNVAGNPDTDPAKANAYQQLYGAQLAYNSAVAQYNYLTGKVNSTQLDADTAAVAIAQAKLQEDQNLLAALTGGSVPADATGSGLAQLNQAKLALQTAQEALDATSLYAPISGTVMAVNNQVGETASGTFITIADLSKADLQIYMDEADWSNIKIGYTSEVTFDALPNQVFTGKVTQVLPQLVSAQGNSLVEGMVQLDQAASADPLELPLGVSASVDVIAAQANNVVLVPVEALHQLSVTSYAVFVVTNGKPTLRIVTVGLNDGTLVEIKTGLKAGEVVTTGTVQVKQ